MRQQFEKYLKMALEATLIMLDNSASSLNGDYLPTRWESQVDSAGLLIQAKLQSNIQSSVGLGLMGGNQVDILCTLTSDSSKVNSYLFGVKIHGSIHFTDALQIGALALKHRSNDTQKQRMVCFIASTIVEDADTLKIFGKKLKKNGVAVDLVCFGDCSNEQRAKVEVFMAAVQQDDSSHSLFIEPGEVYLSEKLLGSEIFNMGGAGGIMGGGGANMDEEDPELAEAIRMSLQESAQQQAAQPTQAQGGNQANREPTQQQLEELAIRLSLQEANQNPPKQEDKGGDQKKQQ